MGRHDVPSDSLSLLDEGAWHRMMIARLQRDKQCEAFLLYAGP